MPRYKYEVIVGCWRGEIHEIVYDSRSNIIRLEVGLDGGKDYGRECVRCRDRIINIAARLAHQTEYRWGIEGQWVWVNLGPQENETPIDLLEPLESLGNILGTYLQPHSDKKPYVPKLLA